LARNVFADSRKVSRAAIRGDDGGMVGDFKHTGGESACERDALTRRGRALDEKIQRFE